MSATILQKKIITYIEQNLAGYAVNIEKSSKRGTPDILACINSKFYAIEVKFGSDTEKPLQLHVLEKIKKAGGIGFFCHSFEEFKKYFES